MSLNRTSFQILEYIDSVELARKVYLKEFAEHNKISDHFISLINKQIQNNKYKALASYFLTNKGVNPKGYLSVIERLKRFYCSIDTQLSYEYELGADIFCQFLAQKELNLKINPENLFNTAIKFYKGKTLDATLFTYIKLALNVNSQLNRKLLNEFYTRCKDPDYIDIIKSEELKYNLATDKNIIDGLILLDKSKSSWSQQLAKYKGKVIYIDFWASWCGPCINEIPFIEKLKKQYVNKDIVFISISTDKQFSDWKWKVDQLKIANSFSFLLADTDNSPLIKSLEIKTIPRFVLIDKTGKIVSKDAIRPSDKNINILIDQFLK
jgi:thiol-disulfide isomerase/thioredoxin